MSLIGLLDSQAYIPARAREDTAEDDRQVLAGPQRFDIRELVFAQKWNWKKLKRY
ncbi:hypothetical protein OK016_01590 [Vibrio chagasii]|nr:hypothetical protein [Vibrio chagasii]